MEDLDDASVPSSENKKRRTIGLNVNICLLCQSQTKETLVENSKCAEKLVGNIKIRSDCNDENYMRVSQYLKDKSVEDLLKSNVKWHLSCHKKCTHKGMLEKLQEKQEKK